MRTADAIVTVLERAGVEVVFGIPGVHNLVLFEAMWASPIRVVVTRHEGAAAHAADGYARATGLPGVVVTTTGPGAANALAGVGEAWAAGSPVVHLTTQIRNTDLGAGVQRGILHQSPGQIDGYRPITRFAETATDAATVPSLVATAAAIAVGGGGDVRWGRPGPAYLEVPFDLLDGAADPLDALPSGSAAPIAQPYDDAVRALADAVNVAVWAGGGVIASRAYTELAAVAERLAAPVVTTYLGRTAMPADHPLAVSYAPHEPEVRRLLAEADVLLAVGTDFGATVTMGGKLRLPERIVRIDIDRNELATTPEALAIVGDAREALLRLDDRLARDGIDRSGAVPEVAARVTGVRSRVRRSVAEDPRTSNAAAFLETLETALPREAIVACDMCVAGYWVGGYLPRYEPRTLLYPLGWGTLGFGLPAAVGAAAARRAPVLAVVGDAGLCYYLGELATARQHDLDMTVLCVNDRGYGMLRFDEERRFGRTFAADLLTPDLGALAAAFDLPYTEAKLGDASLAAAVSRAIEDGGVHLVEVGAALFPPRTSSPRWDEPV
jgi:thiamine pyrophosphate-dependent acetolactate synthase large subunit-like protein